MSSAYETAVLADGPFHYWRCDDAGGGYIQDHQAVTLRPLIAQGQQIGLGYSGPVSDGGSCLVDANFGFAFYDFETIANPFSAELWFWQAYFQNVIQTFLTIQTAAAASTCVVRADATGHLAVFGPAANFTSAAVHSRSAWHHVVVTFDGVNMRTYMDNVLLDTRAQGAFSQASRFIIGSANANGTPMAGSLSEIALYASALSAARVAIHYNSADRVGINPTNQSQQQSGGVLPAPYGDTLSDILAAVRKFF